MHTVKLPEMRKLTCCYCFANCSKRSTAPRNHLQLGRWFLGYDHPRLATKGYITVKCKTYQAQVSGPSINLLVILNLIQ